VGAVPVGIHIEGPYLNPVKRGAQSERAIRPVDLDEARRLLAAGDGLVRIMTFAPELDRSADLIRLLRESAVVPSMGHSSADEETVLAAIGLGASRCTHFYNGMPQLDSRNVRLTAVALTDDSVTIEIITDGVHVHRRMVDLAIRSKPLSRIVAVSDAVQGAGLPDGLYHLGGDEVRIADGHSTRVSDGTIAGSCITLDRAMRNLADFSSLSESEAVACCTVNAARSIGLYDRGEIVPGKRADIVVLNAEREVEMTIVGGRIVYTRSGEIPVCEVAANA
jgi:N-acetylglucosamine-6-phosphate deacetylase